MKCLPISEEMCKITSMYIEAVKLLLKAGNLPSISALLPLGGMICDALGLGLSDGQVCVLSQPPGAVVCYHCAP